MSSLRAILPFALLASFGIAGVLPAQQKPVQKNDPGLTVPAPSVPIPTTPPGVAPATAGPTMTLGGVPYIHRWSRGATHELTPRGQEDLERWTDMLTVIYYPQVRDEAGLAAMAKSVAEAYRRNQGTILKAEIMPAAAGKPAEHFITVTFNKQASEATYARLVLRGGVGVGVLYGHRAYGPRAAQDLADWLRASGPRMDQNLHALEPIPPAASWPPPR